jgi:hypothetical protein
MNRRMLSLVALLALAIPATALAGGPAIVSLNPLNAAVIAGQPVAVDFTINACGQPMTRLTPALGAVSGRDKVRAKAKAFGAPGHYRAMVTFPRAGDWTLAVDTGLTTQKHALQVAVRPAGSEERAAR